MSGQSATAKLAPRTAPIIVQSVDGISLQCAPCCHPVPGDRIAGHMRGGHGLAIHRIDCETAKRQMSRDAERWMEVEWGENISGMFRTLVEVSVHDERGVLGRVAGEIAAHDANIVQVSMDTDAEQMAVIKFTLQVRDRQHLADVFRGLRRLPQFRSLSRH
jgi:GTP diphosphokinase / guanosine-3',5'-bis(diphosphate) 3'-diphosphatase